MIKIGDTIKTIDEGRELTVQQILPIGFTSFDIMVKYNHTTLVDTYGNKVFGNRGFKMSDEGKKWVKLC